MSDPNQTTRLIIQVGDGGDPEQFGFTCGANTFGIKLTNNLGETTVLDCDHPLNVPAAILRHLESQDTSATLSGTVATTAWPTWRRWADDADTKNVKLFLDESAANNGGHYLVPMILADLDLNKEGSGIVQFTVEIKANGRRTWVDAT
ncbi:phage tail tube protein [Shimia sp.]|uniref:phage tail tube protein n=1 Tax=Shimia sp. TaxID=1954381 RepID=UPI003B8B4AE5